MLKIDVVGIDRTLAVFKRISTKIKPVTNRALYNMARRAKKYVRKNLDMAQAPQTAGHSSPIRLIDTFVIDVDRKGDGEYWLYPRGMVGGSLTAAGLAEMIESGFSLPHEIPNAFGSGRTVWHPGVGKGRAGYFKTTKGFFTRAIREFITNGEDKMIIKKETARLMR